MTATSWVPSRKVLAGAVTGVVVFALTKLAISLDPITEQALNVLVAFGVAYIVPASDADALPSVPVTPASLVPKDEGDAGVSGV